MSRKFGMLLLLPVVAAFSAPAFAGSRHGGQGQGNHGHPPPQNQGYHHQNYPHGAQYRWHGTRYYWHGQPYWRISINTFPRYGWGVWRGGYWYRGYHGGRWGWWWLAGGAWYYYPTPVYPYPNPYVPYTPGIVPAPAQAPVQYWYYCSAPQGYYPYVPQCSTAWTPVTATPVSAAPQPSGASQYDSPQGQPPPQGQPTAQYQDQAPGSQAQGQAPVQYWYYCNSPQGYYPTVSQCPGGWTTVPASQPPDASPPPG
jgi:hypothetical protein